MPRKDEPRVTVRFGRVEHALLLEQARERGVTLSALVRERAVASIRSVPEASGAAGGERSRPVPPAAPQPVRIDTPSQARQWALDRQRRLNEGKL